MAINYKRLNDSLKSLPSKHRAAASALFFHMIANGGHIHGGGVESVAGITRSVKRGILQRLVEAGIIDRGDKANKIATIKFTAAVGYKEKQPTNKPVNSEQSEAIMRVWEKHREEAPPKNRESLKAVFDDMQRIDGASWEEINEVVGYVAMHWQEYLQSPSALRKRSRKYPDLWTWEVARNQMKNGRNGRAVKFTPRRPKLTREMSDQ